MTRRSLLLAVAAALGIAVIAIVIATTRSEPSRGESATTESAPTVSQPTTPPALPTAEPSSAPPRPDPAALKAAVGIAKPEETEDTRKLRAEGEAACLRRDQAAAQVAYNKASVGARIAISIACKEQKIDLAPPPKNQFRFQPARSAD